MPPFTLTPRRSLRRIVTVLVAVGAWGWTAGQTTVPADSGNVITMTFSTRTPMANPIWSQGGGIFKFGDTYYWYGVKYNGAVTYYNDPSAGMVTGSGFNAVTCYSSTDLVHWKFENNILSTSTPGVNPAGWSAPGGGVQSEHAEVRADHAVFEPRQRRGELLPPATLPPATSPSTMSSTPSPTW